MKSRKMGLFGAAAAMLLPIAGVVSAPDSRAATDIVVAAVGDMACDPEDAKYNAGLGTPNKCGELAVSTALFQDASVSAVLGLGDYQYDCGDLADYAVSYNPTWGRVDGIMRPTAGNHEYKTGNDVFGRPCPSSNGTATNFFAHFGAAAHPETYGHFSFNLGSWHFIALNANCGRPNAGCAATSAQTTWLKSDLATNTQPCIAAFWHQAFFTGVNLGSQGTLLAYKPWWDVLYSNKVDVVLNGHVHNYQRYPPLSPAGVSDPTQGITEYVVGTGGEALISTKSTAAVKPVVWLKTFGYLRIALQSNGWIAEFVNSAGAVVDTSSGTCH